MSWPLRRLGDVATIERRGVDPRTLRPEIRYLGLEDIERGGRIKGHHAVGDVDLASTKFVFDDGHVLFGKLRPNLGKVARPSFGGVCSTDILPIRPGNSMDRAFLHHYLAQPSMVEFASSRSSGANLPRLSPTALAAFEIPMPPLAEQRRIAAILDHADALRAKRRQALAHLDDLTQSIFLDMFSTGLGGAERSPLGSYVEVITKGTTPTSVGLKYAKSGVPFLRVQNIEGGTVRFDPDDLYIDDEAHFALRRSRVP